MTKDDVKPAGGQAKKPDTIGVSEIQSRLGLSRNSVYDAIARKEIPSLRFGRRIVVPRAPFERMLGGDS